MTTQPFSFCATTLQAIGQTPLVRLNKVVPPGSADVFVKLEYYNPTGSYKDRMALAMIEAGEEAGSLQPGMTVVECTGTSLAFVCAVKGYPFTVVTSDAFAKEKLQTMKAFGADLVIVPSEGGKITPDLVPTMRERARELAQRPGLRVPVSSSPTRSIIRTPSGVTSASAPKYGSSLIGRSMCSAGPSARPGC